MIDTTKFRCQPPVRYEIDLYPNFILNRSVIQPTNVFEIGSHNGDDAEYLRQCFGLEPEDVFCFEPHPQTFQELTEKYPRFNAIQAALSNKSGTTTFHCAKSDVGVSSMRHKVNLPSSDYEDVEVQMLRMEDVITHYGITHIDVCKVDVEGCGFEVLEGFGSQLSIVKSIQMEAEKWPLFQGQHVYEDIKIFLQTNGFNLANYFDLGSQCDSLWIRNELFTVK